MGTTGKSSEDGEKPLRQKMLEEYGEQCGEGELLGKVGGTHPGSDFTGLS